MAISLKFFFRVSVFLVAMALLGVVATTSGAAEGDTTFVSVDSSGNQANSHSYGTPSISSDGRFVAFGSSASNLVANDTNNRRDVFVRDRQAGTTERVSVDSLGMQANERSFDPSISADGRFVAFFSPASNLVPNDTNGWYDVFVHDQQTGTTELVSVDSSGNQGNSLSQFPSISADGRFVAFHAYASNLVPNDTNRKLDVFVHDRQTGTTERVSVNSSGNQAYGFSHTASISADGRFVAFESRASGLVENDTKGNYDVFVHERQTGTTQRVSVDSLGNQGNWDSYNPSISADGRFVAFRSYAFDLITNDTNGTLDVFVHERDTTAPKVRRVVPTEGATGIALKADVVATFSERMMAKSTLTRANFELYKIVRNSDGTTTAKQIENVTVRPGLDGLRATLNPYGTTDGQLAKDTRYKAVVRTGALDVFGNPLDQQPRVSGNQPKVWYFKTRG